MAIITRTSPEDRERLRRSAASADQGPTAEQQANAYPRGQQLDYLGLPQDPTNVTFPFLRRMRRDHIIAMGLHYIAMPIVRAPWYVEADDARVAAFVDNLIRPIYGRLMLVLLRMLWSGYSPACKSFQTVNPAWTYLPGINQDPKRVWDQGDIDAMVYKPVIPLRPENAMPVWKNGNFNGIAYDSRYGGLGYFLINGQRRPEIDVDHAIWVAHDTDSEDGDPYGYPRIAYCAPICHMYWFIWDLLGRAYENNADPGPVVRFPRDDMPGVDSDGNALNNVDAAIRIGRRKRSGSTIAMPSEPYTDYQDKPTSMKKWDIEYPKNETNFKDLMEFLGFLESAKLRGLGLQEQGLIESSGAQSNRNTMASAAEQRDDSQVVLMGQLDEVIMDIFVKPAMAMNMPWYEGSLTKKNIGFGSEEQEVTRQLIQLAGQEDYRNFGVNMRQILEAYGQPMLSPADYKVVQAQIAKEAETKPTPAVTPTQGRRALVTQTGFDRETRQAEMSYVQIEDPIHLSGDDDFVSSLPRTDVFSDQRVVGATRSLRSEAMSFLTWAYGDFARYLGKQKSLDLDALLQEVAVEHFAETGEELADGDRVLKATAQILARWKPSSVKIDGFSGQARSTLGRVFDRTSGLQLSRLSSKERLTSQDKIVSALLDQQSDAMIASALETTRVQIASVLADGIRAKKNAQDIAADIREHFEGAPAARAARIAKHEVALVYNYATVSAGMAAGVKKGQILDSDGGDRNGQIVNLPEAVDDPSAQFCVRLLPRASDKFEVRYEQLDGLSARFDPDTETVLFTPDFPADRQSAYLISLGEILSCPVDPQEV